LYLQVDQIT